MKVSLRYLCILILLVGVGGAPARAQNVRVKDIASIEGVRSNQLLGYGLIIGLEGSGDSQQTRFTTQSVANMLETYGISVPADKMKVKNVAAVIVTANLPAFARQGTAIDVVVSSLGDARSLQGGTLLQTPLRAANGMVYAAAQGPVSIGGFGASGGGSSATKNHQTVGRVPGGAVVEKDTKTEIAVKDVVSITLNKGDFTTASRTATAIDTKLGGHFAKAVDANAISVTVPPIYENDLVGLVAAVESVEVTTDTTAKVIVNERTGTVIIGAQARITPIAVSHGALTVEIATGLDVSQPQPVSGGATVVVPKTEMKVKEETASLTEINGGSTVSELISALNALHVTPRDLIAILQAIKEAGALQAQLEII